jgi:hypothetical protein
MNIGRTIKRVTKLPRPIPIRVPKPSHTHVPAIPAIPAPKKGGTQ